MSQQTLPPLQLSVKRSAFRSDDPGADTSDARFSAIRVEVLERDNYECAYCNFRSKKFQEVHHLDDNHSNNDESNLVTICSLCHMVFHIAHAGHRDKGTLIYLDEDFGVDQAQLNSLVRALWIGEKSKDAAIRATSINILSRLIKQSVPVSRKLGTSSPADLGEFFMSLSDDQYALRGRLTNGLYLLPSKQAYKRHIGYWEKSAFSGTASDSWLSIATQRINKWGVGALELPDDEV